MLIDKNTTRADLDEFDKKDPSTRLYFNDRSAYHNRRAAKSISGSITSYDGKTRAEFGGGVGTNAISLKVPTARKSPSYL